MNIIDIVEEFILEQRVRGNSKHTISYYRRSLVKFTSLTAIQSTEEITIRKCKEYYIKLTDTGLSSVSVQSYIRGLRTFLSWLYQNEYIEQDITQKFKLPKAQRKIIDVLTDSEINILLNSFSTQHIIGLRNKCICLLMFDSGLRLNEVVRLTLADFHLDEKYAIVTGKGDKQRIVPIGNKTIKEIKKYMLMRPRGDMFFLKEDGEPIQESTIKNMFRKLKNRTGIERLYPHLLRHTFATRYLENGGNIYTLQIILGHTSLEMVKKYLHLATSRIRSDFGKYSPNDNLKRTP